MNGKEHHYRVKNMKALLIYLQMINSAYVSQCCLAETSNNEDVKKKRIKNTYKDQRQTAPERRRCEKNYTIFLIISV